MTKGPGAQPLSPRTPWAAVTNAGAQPHPGALSANLAGRNPVPVLSEVAPASPTALRSPGCPPCAAAGEEGRGRPGSCRLTGLSGVCVHISVGSTGRGQHREESDHHGPLRAPVPPTLVTCSLTSPTFREAGTSDTGHPGGPVVPQGQLSSSWCDAEEVMAHGAWHLRQYQMPPLGPGNAHTRKSVSLSPIYRW